MKKKYISYIAVSSLLGLGTYALYKYNKNKKIEKNTREYIENLSEEEKPKRKYIKLNFKNNK